MSFSYPKETRKTCRHLFTDGHRCGSPALTEEPFCYYHHTTRKPITNPKSRRSRQSTFTLPRCEDRSSIQHSIGEIIHHLTQNTLDTKRAGLLLYALQTASHNLPKPDPNAKPVDILSTIHSNIVDDPTHGLIAPELEFGKQPNRPKSLAELLMGDNFKEKLRLGEEIYEQQQQEKARKLQQAEANQHNPQPTTLPQIQATAATTTPIRLDPCPSAQSALRLGSSVLRPTQVPPQPPPIEDFTQNKGRGGYLTITSFKSLAADH